MCACVHACVRACQCLCCLVNSTLNQVTFDLVCIHLCTTVVMVLMEVFLCTNH